jgi:hypothetical protein
MPRGLEMSRPTLACVGLSLAILVFATADLIHTGDRVPAAGAATRQCSPSDKRCVRVAQAAQTARVREAEHLESQYKTRSWLYAFGIAALIAVAAAYSLRARDRKEWPRVFTNLGVIGVWAAIAGTVVVLLTDDDEISVAAGPAYTVAILLIAAAVTGTVIGRSEGWASESQIDGVRKHASRLGQVALHVGTGGASSQSKLDKLARWFSIAAYGLSALTAALALVFSLAQPGCGGDAPGWAAPFGSAASVSAVAAVAAGVGALVLRRWVPALVAVVINPVAFLAMIISTCLD